MRIAVVGSGKMGRGFAQALAGAHEVVGSRNEDRAVALAAKIGAAGGATYAGAVAGADVVILAVPWTAMTDTLAQFDGLTGAVVIDMTFAYNKQQRADLRGRSTAEVIQSRLPEARVVKGWNHVFAVHLAAPEIDGIAASVLIAGDDRDAKEIVFTIARDMGFHPVDVGPLRAARDLETLAGTMTFIKLGPFRVLSSP